MSVEESRRTAPKIEFKPATDDMAVTFFSEQFFADLKRVPACFGYKTLVTRDGRNCKSEQIRNRSPVLVGVGIVPRGHFSKRECNHAEGGGLLCRQDSFLYCSWVRDLAVSAGKNTTDHQHLKGSGTKGRLQPI